MLNSQDKIQFFKIIHNKIVCFASDMTVHKHFNNKNPHNYQIISSYGGLMTVVIILS